MKAIKITYWITTLIITLMMTFSAYSYLTQDKMIQIFQHLGFPGYFRIELAVAKFTGVLVLLLPVNSKLKEWAYAGFTIVFISAIIAHTASGDPVANRVVPVVFLVILGISYFTYYKKQALAGA